MGRDHGDFAGRVQRVGGCGRISRQVGSGVVRNFFFFFYPPPGHEGAAGESVYAPDTPPVIDGDRVGTGKRGNEQQRRRGGR